MLQGEFVYSKTIGRMKLLFDIITARFDNITDVEHMSSDENIRHILLMDFQTA